jgi:tetratricopeptide (TPR) repeat protein
MSLGVAFARHYVLKKAQSSASSHWSKAMLEKLFGLFGKKKGSLGSAMDSPISGSSAACEELCLKSLSDKHAKELNGDVLFVHGMGGDPFGTWTVAQTGIHWGTWLAESRPDLRFWSLGYPSSPSLWAGRAMPLQDRAINLLALLKADGIGKNPICFITHSLGGLLVKQMLREAVTSGTDEYKNLGEATRGVVFLATPHTGSDLATIAHYLRTILRTTPVIEDMRDNAALLRTLNNWYIQNVDSLGIKNKVFFETRPTFGVTIVDESSGGMVVKGGTPIPIDANHVEICKPPNKSALVYTVTREFLAEILPKDTPPPVDRMASVGSVASGQQLEHPVTPVKIPFPRNSFFTGRDDILSQLHNGFRSGDTVQYLKGLDGIGKTQTALEYAYQNKDEYETVLWADAQSQNSLIAAYRGFADLLELEERSEKDHEKVIAAVKRWIENKKNVLLVLDNAKDPKAAGSFIPTDGTRHVLLTTIAPFSGAIATRRDMPLMSPQEGALFLLRRLRRLIPADAPLEAASEQDREQAEKLTILLGGLPLALDQASAYIENTDISIEKYCSLYRQALLKNPDTSESVAVTFSMLFDEVRNANPATADLLRLCAFLNSDAIPEELFSKAPDMLGDNISLLEADRLGFEKMFSDGVRFSILQRNTGDTISIHRLVQVVIRDSMDVRQRRLWAERAVRAVSKIFPLAEYGNWAVCERLAQHAYTLSDAVDEFNFVFPEAAEMRNRAGKYLKERAYYSYAESMLRRSMVIYEKMLGTEHPGVINVANNLASLYREQERYDEAKSLYERCLAIGERAPEPNQREMAAVLNNLALIYRAQGKYDSAESTYKRCLAIYENVLKLEDVEFSDILNNLAQLYYSKGKEYYDEAERLYNRSLTIRKTVLKNDDPRIATVLNNLASLYSEQGKYDEAEMCFFLSLAINKKALGEAHPRVTTTLSSIAENCLLQGKRDEAIRIYKQSLQIQEEAKNTERTEYASTLCNLANIYYSNDEFSETAPLYKRSLDIYEKTLGPEHTNTRVVKDNYDRVRKFLDLGGIHSL